MSIQTLSLEMRREMKKVENSFIALLENMREMIQRDGADDLTVSPAIYIAEHAISRFVEHSSASWQSALYLDVDGPAFLRVSFMSRVRDDTRPFVNLEIRSRADKVEFLHEYYDEVLAAHDGLTEQGDIVSNLAFITYGVFDYCVKSKWKFVSLSKFEDYRNFEYWVDTGEFGIKVTIDQRVLWDDHAFLFPEGVPE